MSSDGKVIWKKGDEIMPDKAKYVVDAARGELLLKTLQLPEEIVNTIRYNADKSAQSVNDYVSHIVVERLISAS
ncbi:hypothetical protein [Treponema primitia]|uniref:hypothetical protein n=1 Tax=Treponema primitia TaxID=88058 RepID=UPI0002555364|nr:hypothetical protein [Treponema primitia]